MLHHFLSFYFRSVTYFSTCKDDIYKKKNQKTDKYQFFEKAFDEAYSKDQNFLWRIICECVSSAPMPES